MAASCRPILVVETEAIGWGWSKDAKRPPGTSASPGRDRRHEPQDARDFPVAHSRDESARIGQRSTSLSRAGSRAHKNYQRRGVDPATPTVELPLENIVRYPNTPRRSVRARREPIALVRDRARIPQQIRAFETWRVAVGVAKASNIMEPPEMPDSREPDWTMAHRSI